MAKELKPTAGAETGAAPAGAGAPPPATPEGQAVTPPAVSPDIQALVEEAVKKVRTEYEGKGGHVAKLKSEYDKKIADLKRQVEKKRAEEYQEAMGLLEQGDHEQAARVLADQVAQLTEEQQNQDREAQVADWVERIMGDLGYDLQDEAAAAQATEWLGRLQAQPDLTYDFVMETSKARIEAEKKAAEAATKEVAALKEAIPQLVRAEVAKALTGAGLTPQPTGEGGAPSSGDDWRKWDTGRLIKEGLASRARAPIVRIPKED